jgi:predicted CXXCH cytochrome family protein
MWVARPQSAGPRFLRPFPESVVDSGPLAVIAKGKAGATLLLDGRAIGANSPGPGALAVTVTVTPGRHELTVRDETGTTTIAIFVRGPKDAGPEGWKNFQAHPPPALKATCQTCHAVKDGQWTFAGESLAANCFACHQREKFSTVHTHEPPVLRDCQMCHLPHGSTEARHLKMPPKASCEQCHPL